VTAPAASSGEPSGLPTPPSSGLLDRARAWLAQDPDPVTRGELAALVAAGEAADPEALAELDARFAGRLEFGTAGLRGELGAGPMRMNRVLVAQAAAGLGAYLLSRSERPSAVIGYDGRLGSRVFAEDSAEILAGLGVETTLLPRMLPTPVLAFAVRALGASAGVMVTASHNPARDNGYKVYLGGADEGSQIVPPADAAIAAEIERAAASPVSGLARSQEYAIAAEELVEEYVLRTAGLARHRAPLRVVYTPMHGVGREVFERVVAAAGFEPVTVVTAQADPDPAFPTVAFPNPEEEGAMDLSFALAAETGADLVIAHDPDADRVAVGIPDPASPGGWRRLSGNQLGWLLGWEAARAAQDSDMRDAAASPATASSAAAPPTASAGTSWSQTPGSEDIAPERPQARESGALANSLVSSPALGAVAAAYGLRHEETLTGFKWISRVPGLVFGYEEALGYLVDPDKVRDKDGVSAAVAVLSLAAELRARGAGLADRLAEFADAFGGYASGQLSIRVAVLGDIARMMQRLREAPPAAIGGLAVEAADDFLTGVGGFPPSDILRYRLDGGARVIVRPSGTEPKLKCYLDAVSVDGSGAERVAAAEAVVARLASAMRELLGA